MSDNGRRAVTFEKAVIFALQQVQAMQAVLWLGREGEKARGMVHTLIHSVCYALC